MTCWCFCRSCDAGLQAGAAKCQTLTIFESRRAVENFIQTHVRDLIAQRHTCSANKHESGSHLSHGCTLLCTAFQG